MKNTDEIKKVIGIKVAPLVIAATIGLTPAAVMADSKVELDKDVKKIVKEDEEQINKKSPEYETVQDAENWVSNEESNLKDDYEITKKGVEEIAKEEKTTIEISENFKTEEEADNYIKENENKNNFEVTKTENYSEWNKTDSLTKEETGFESKKDAMNKANAVKEEYEQKASDVVKYEVTITETETKDKVFIREKVTSKTSNFDTLKEAEDYIKGLKLEENENIKITISGPIEKQIAIGEEEGTINQTFKTMEEAKQFIKGYEESGYEVSNVSIEEKTTYKENKVETDGIIVNSQNKLDSNDKYEVNGNYIMIKQASSHVVIWTPEELNSKQKENFESSWKKVNSDGSVSGQEFIFISGEGSKDLSYIGNSWGTYDITQSNGKIIMTCDKSKVSHLNYGSYEKEYKIERVPEINYEVLADTKKTIYKKTYEVNAEIAEKEYEDVTLYGYSALINKFEREKSYNLTGSYDDINVIILYQGFIEANKLGKELPPQEKIKSNDSTPQTSDESDIELALAGMGLGLAGLSGLALERKRQKTRIRK